jgi:hypothetical protein
MNCPICQKQLKSVGKGDTYAFYQCPTQNIGSKQQHGPNPPGQHRFLNGPGESQDKTHRSHYFVEINPKDDSTVKMQVDIPGFHLKYAYDKTQVYKVHEKNSDCYDYVFTLDGQFPVDWNNLQHSTDRIKTLLVFS